MAVPALKLRGKRISGHRTVKEAIEKWVWPRPLAFEEFIDLFDGREEIVELINGEVIVEMGAQLDHEMLIAWLLRALGNYAESADLGIVLGSRTPVKINDFSGRLPDILYVAKERREIVQQRAIYGPPDLIIEVRSPGSRKSSVVGLEADYRSLGVAEYILIDPKRRSVRILRRRESGYEETELTEGLVVLESIPGAALELGWLFSNSRPTALSVVQGFLSADNQRKS